MNEAAQTEDAELLRRYAEEGAEDAFAELVRRRIGLVYSVALRHTRGDRHRAEDATQAVFTDLARKAKLLADRPVLAGWLYRSAQFAAAGLMRAEARRHVREQEAHTMENDSAREGAATDWDKVRPVLDEALNAIDERDRDAIVLRFFDGRPFAEIGVRLRVSENAARMRVERALDRLQGALSSRGITSTTAALGVALGNQVTLAAPAGLAAAVTGAALAQGAASGGAIVTFLAMTKLQIAVTVAVALGGLAAYVSQAQANASLRAEIAALRPAQAALDAARAENKRLAATVAEAEVLRGDDAEFKQLERQVADARQAQERAKAQRVAASRPTEAEIQVEIDRLNQEGNRLVAEYKTLLERLKNPQLTPAQRAQTEAAAQLKFEAIKAKQQQVQAFIAEVKAENPQFTSRSGTKARELPNGAGTIQLSNGPEITDGLLAISMPDADYKVALAAYEKIARIKIVRDPSLEGVTGPINLELGRGPRDQMLERMRAALRQQNIALEAAADGTYVAKRIGN